MNSQRSLFHDTAPTFDEVMSVWGQDRIWRSRWQIAQALGRSKSPALIATITMLATVGYLTCRVEKLPNGIDYYLYSVSQKWLDQAAPF